MPVMVVDGKLTITNPTVAHPGFVEFVQDGEVVATVDASFDFSRLSPELQVLALSVLRGFRVGLPSKQSNIDAKARVAASPRKPWWKFWR